MVVVAADDRAAYSVTVFGRASGHLFKAREVLLAYDSTTFLERITIEALVTQIDLLIAAVRKLHHRTTLGDE